MKTFHQFQKLVEINLPAEPGEIIDQLIEIHSQLEMLLTAALTIQTHLSTHAADKGSKFNSVYKKIEKLSAEAQEAVEEIRDDITMGVLAISQDTTDKEELREPKQDAEKAKFEYQAKNPGAAMQAQAGDGAGGGFPPGKGGAGGGGAPGAGGAKGAKRPGENRPQAAGAPFNKPGYKPKDGKPKIPAKNSPDQGK